MYVEKSSFDPVWQSGKRNLTIAKLDESKLEYIGKIKEFKTNDILYFREYDKNCTRPLKYTGRKMTFRVINVSITGEIHVEIVVLEKISIFAYVDSETYKKLDNT